MEDDIQQTIQISFAQAALLNQIQTAYQGSRHLALKAQFQRAMLVTICRGINSKLHQEEMLRNSVEDTSSQDRGALRWFEQELTRRLTYGIWVRTLRSLL